MFVVISRHWNVTFDIITDLEIYGKFFKKTERAYCLYLFRIKIWFFSLAKGSIY